MIRIQNQGLIALVLLSLLFVLLKAQDTKGGWYTLGCKLSG